MRPIWNLVAFWKNCKEVSWAGSSTILLILGTPYVVINAIMSVPAPDLVIIFWLTHKRNFLMLLPIESKLLSTNFLD